MKLIVRPEWRVNHIEVAVPHAVISITDPAPYGRPANIEPRAGQLAVGRWEFCDLKDASHPLAMRLDHANGILDFVLDQLAAGAEAFVVHCFAAAKRSPSIAIALADAWRWPHACIEWHKYEPVERKRYRPPNRHVYETMMAAFVARRK